MPRPSADLPVADEVARVLAERARALAAPAAAPEQRGELHLAARTGSVRFCVAARRAVRVVAIPPVTPAPAAGAAVIGVAAVAGQLVPVVRLDQIVGPEASLAAPGAQLLVVDDDGEQVGIAVDAVEGLVALDDRLDARVPGGDGVLLVSGSGALVLDLDALLAHDALAPRGGAGSSRTEGGP